MLDLSGNRIGAAGAATLALALERQTTPDPAARRVAAAVAATAITQRRDSQLEDLSLARNGVGDAGAQHLARALERNGRLRALDLAGNGVTVRGALRLAEALR